LSRPPQLEEERFVAFDADADRFAAVARRCAEEEGARKVIEIGCGDGAVALALARSGASVTGLDISEKSIALARSRVVGEPSAQALEFVCADYFHADLPDADLIVAHSALHLIAGDDRALAQKLARDVRPGGRLVATMPDDCIANRLILTLRRLLRAIRAPWLDTVILRVATAVYPDVPSEALRDRVVYMYVLPARLCSRRWRGLMQDAGFELLDCAPWPNTSCVKPSPVLLCWRRRAAMS
jgi:trans-aconitate 2-methyltransferase